MKHVKKYLDWIVLLVCFVGYFIEFNYPEEQLFRVLGFLGAIYCVVTLCRYSNPIKRDWLLVKGNFLIKVVNSVFLIPFVITFILWLLALPENISISEDNARNLTFNQSKYEQNDTNDTQVVANTATHDAPSMFWMVYYNFIDPGNQHEPTTESGRNRSSFIAILGFFLLNGLLISMLISWFDRRREKWLNGEIRYNLSLCFKRIAVVIGANESAPIIIKKLVKNEGEKPVDYVILLTNDDVKKVREHIMSYLNEEEEKKVIIYNGELDSAEEIAKLRIHKATEIYVLGENSKDDVSHSYHDAQNMKCVHNIASRLAEMNKKEVPQKIVCRVLFEYQTTYSVFQFSDLPHNIRKHLNFIPVNAYENWAQCVFVKGLYTEQVGRLRPAVLDADSAKQAARVDDGKELRVINYTPLDGTGISETSKNHVHLVIVGMSKMGVAMAIQAAQIAHYPNFTLGRKSDDGKVLREPSLRRTRITFVDTDGENEMNFFMGRFQNLFALSRYRYLDCSSEDCDLNKPWTDPMTLSDCEYKAHGDNFVDVEWEFVKGNVQDPAVMKYLRNAAAAASAENEEKSLLTVAICLPLAHEAIAAALYMPGVVYDNAQQILVYQREASDIIYNVGVNEEESQEEIKSKRYAKLLPFGMQYADFTTDKENYYRAQLCCYVYNLMYDDSVDNKHIFDIIAGIDISDRSNSHVKVIKAEWEKSTIFNRWSNRYLANSFETKLRSIGACLGSAHTHYATMCKLIENNEMAMAECEHNRWILQQLLMGFRAYKDVELEEYRGLKNDDENKDRLKKYKDQKKKGREKAHLNICSMKLLHEYDKKSENFDAIFNASIPAVMKSVERKLKSNKEISEY